jgi:hypothetical protein
VLKMARHITLPIFGEVTMIKTKATCVRGLVRSKLVFFLAILLIVPLVATMGSAATDSELAEQYAPVLYFEGEETCYPVDVSYHIDNSYLYQIIDDEAQLVTETPSEADLSSYSSDDYYLDNQQGTVDDLGIIADYQSKLSTLGYTVYARVVSDGGYTIIQYWMFYAFNKGELNQHEGDWEMVQLVLSGDTPEQVMYSQHYSGQRTTWDQVESTGDHFNVYVARGSHANYLRYYSGKLGVANDYVGNNGRILQPSGYTLKLLEPDSEPWLSYAGQWGWVGATEEDAEVSSLLGQAGPSGPMFRAESGSSMWNDPLLWGAGLGQLDNNVLLIEWLLYHFVTIFLLVTMLALGIGVYRIYRRHKTTGLGPRIVSMLYIDGVNLKSIGNILCFVGIVIAVFGLTNQWYSVSYGLTGTSVVEGYTTTSMVDVFNIDGINGIQITIPGSSGPVPMGSFSMPFSLIMGIGFLFLVIASVGLIESKKLGKKYIWRGIKLLIPVIIIIVVIMFIGNIISGSMADMGDEASGISGIFDFTSSPLGGQQSMSISEVGGALTLQWGLGLGGQLLVLSGIVFIVAGILEIASKKTFFEAKAIEAPKKKKSKKTVEPEKPTEKVEEIELPTSEGSEEKK